VRVDRTESWDVILSWQRVSSCESTESVYTNVCRDVILCAQCTQCSHSQIPILAQCAQYLTVRAPWVCKGKSLETSYCTLSECLTVRAQWVSTGKCLETSHCEHSKYFTLSTVKVSSRRRHSLVYLHTPRECLSGYTSRMSIENIYWARLLEDDTDSSSCKYLHRISTQKIYTEYLHRRSIQKIYTEYLHRRSTQNIYTGDLHRRSTQNIYTEYLHRISAQKIYTEYLHRISNDNMYRECVWSKSCCIRFGNVFLDTLPECLSRMSIDNVYPECLFENNYREYVSRMCIHQVLLHTLEQCLSEYTSRMFIQNIDPECLPPTSIEDVYPASLFCIHL